MQRFNIFLLIHKGLRHLLFETATLLQQTDFANEAEAEAALDRVRETLLLFEEHARHEDHHVLPAVATYEPSVSDRFAQEHVTDHLLGQELTASVETFFLAPDAVARRERGDALRIAFNAFLVFNLQHMAKEESLLNELLWRYYDDSELQTLNARIVQSVQPWIADLAAHWMLLGNTVPDCSAWMKGVAAAAPLVVYDSLLQKAAAVLPAQRWLRLRERLENTPTFI
ncbi:hypothetical protein EPD60_05980 [Flaviaesturariibacter flavus]|uniref:Uncharacterized protein n=1 Tax=Flaviaesturariibacter flavus TaxID=2502780 RepID=A0A4R1BK84_9BACT|nr:hemerythrin domain-containing protein [Flaviaesturariibacter flavus]TCJ17734.1 hypothetical protein EPD60_05980 [Flaviaesturariibacter flavus]